MVAVGERCDDHGESATWPKKHIAMDNDGADVAFNNRRSSEMDVECVVELFDWSEFSISDDKSVDSVAFDIFSFVAPACSELLQIISRLPQR
jgi:hypothetical protein